MKIYTELLQVVANEAHRQQLIGQVSDLLAERSALKQQILDLLAGDAATLAKATALFDKSEAFEARIKAGIPTP